MLTPCAAQIVVKTEEKIAVMMALMLSPCAAQIVVKTEETMAQIPVP
jgi:hypothetical protein